jgi:hypothetical protein
MLRKHVRESSNKTREKLEFMSEEHHSVRNYVVKEIPRIGESIPPERIAEDLELTEERVIPILDELEKHMTFLFRDENGAVEWAYPVTVADTPHKITFNTGEKINAA